MLESASARPIAVAAASEGPTVDVVEVDVTRGKDTAPRVELELQLGEAAGG